MAWTDCQLNFSGWGVDTTHDFVAGIAATSLASGSQAQRTGLAMEVWQSGSTNDKTDDDRKEIHSVFEWD